MTSKDRATKVLRLSAVTMMAASGSLFATQEAKADGEGCDSTCNVVTTDMYHCCAAKVCDMAGCTYTYYRYN